MRSLLPTLQRTSLPTRPLSLLALLLGGLVIAGLVALLAWTLLAERTGYRSGAITATGNLARVLEEQTARSLQTVDLTLSHVADTWSQERLELPTHPARMHALLRARLAEVGGVRALFMVDARGRMIHDSDALPAQPLDFSDREYFRWHLENPPGLFIGKPTVSRTTGAPFLPVSRRVVDAHGRFAGVVIAAIEPLYFERVFATLDVGTDGLINLRHWDSELIARVPHLKGAVGTRISSTDAMRDPITEHGAATGELVSVFDGVNRFYTARRVRNLPLIVWVGLSESEVLAPWERSVAASAIVGLAFVAVTVWLTLLLTRALRRREQLMTSLERSESLLRQVVESLPVGVTVTGPDGRVSMMNAAAERLHGEIEPGATLQPIGWSARTGERVKGPEWALAQALATGHDALNDMVHMTAADGSRRAILHSAVPIFSASRELRGAIAVEEDLTERYGLVAALRENEARYEAMFRNSIDAILLERADGGILSANPEACRRLGYSEIELQTLGRDELVDITSPGWPQMLAELDRTGQATGELTMIRSDGSRFPAEVSSSMFRGRDGAFEVVVILRDITERRNTEARIQHLAYHDTLTTLPNRASFDRCLREHLVDGRRNARGFALMLVDLDGFKLINDTLGHEVGDQILRDVATRLRSDLRESDFVARLGGDEFVLLVDDPEDGENGAAALARKLLDAIAEPFHHAGHALHLTASIGIALFPRDGRDGRSLLKHADLAMYRAKEQGRDMFHFFSEELNVRSQRRLALESALRRAIDHDELRLCYQQKFDLATGRMTGVEALLRWEPPGGPAIEPMEFIPVAEETGLIVAIGEWTLRTAAAHHRAWRDAGLDVPRIAVNLSARQLADERLPERIAQLIAESGGTDAQWLEIEITESVLMRNLGQSSALLRRFKAMGVRIAVDDFGTGYSSLSYLTRLPIDCVKIDRSFIRDVPGNEDATAIVRAIVALAHSLRLTTVAEGVETAEQRDFLRALGCDEMQGFLGGQPVFAEAMVCP